MNSDYQAFHSFKKVLHENKLTQLNEGLRDHGKTS